MPRINLLPWRDAQRKEADSATDATSQLRVEVAQLRDEAAKLREKVERDQEKFKKKLDKSKEEFAALQAQADAAKATLTWLANNAVEDEARTIARLRLAGLLFDAKQYDQALQQVDAAKAVGFEALAADRRGDVLSAQGKRAEAVAAYQTAWKLMDPTLDYRRLIDAKLTALGAAPEAPAAASAAAEAAR